MCHRHHGIGADGVLVYEVTRRRRDDAVAECGWQRVGLSGNGMRCLAALVARTQSLHKGATITIDTDAGKKTLEMLSHDPRALYVSRRPWGSRSICERPRSRSPEGR